MMKIIAGCSRYYVFIETAKDLSLPKFEITINHKTFIGWSG
jgi:hypothetical protein